MLCAKILRVPSQHSQLANTLEYAIKGMTTTYERALAWALRHRVVVLATVALLVAGAVLVFTRLKVEFVPPEDRGQMQISITGPEGATLAVIDQYQKQVEAILGRIPEIDNYTSTVGGGGGGGGGGSVNRGQIFVRFVDWSQRKRTAQQIIESIRPELAKITGVLAFANNPPAFGGYGSAVQYVVRNSNFDSLFTGMQAMLARARQVKGITNVDTDLRINKPELAVSYDRDRAEDLGVPVRAVAGTMQALLGGQRVSTFTQNNKLYYVMVQLSPEERATPTDMSGLAVRGNQGELIKLDQLAKVTEGVGPRSLSHFGRVRAATLSAGLAPGFTLGEALDSLDRIAKDVLPAGSSTALAGESRELRESGTSLYFAFLLALIVVFMVLASQFESMMHPFTVLMAVPLAITGAVFTLFVAKSSINLYSQIGMILLIGLVAKNSILLVDYTNKLRDKGMETRDALLEAGRVRLRPILMTSVAVVISAVPIALALGAGSISRRPLGYAIVGGVVFSTALTLFIVPLVYSLMEGARVRVRSVRRRAAATQPLPITESK
jgi:multidrug efflux pump